MKKDWWNDKIYQQLAHAPVMLLTIKIVQYFRNYTEPQFVFNSLPYLKDVF